MNPPARILSLDIGGTGIKGALLDPAGKFLEPKIRLPTPPIKSAKGLVKVLDGLAKKFTGFEAVSIGFPGLVHGGKIRSCPTLRCDALIGVNLEELLAAHFKTQVRVLNDAEMQALPAISGRGLEVVVTLGTGVGFAIFQDSLIGSHLELSTHPLSHDQTYNERLGAAALKERGKKKWRRDVEFAIETLRHFTHFDTLYLGGGNASQLEGLDQPGVKIISNDLGIVGGAWVWRTPESGAAP